MFGIPVLVAKTGGPTPRTVRQMVVMLCLIIVCMYVCVCFFFSSVSRVGTWKVTLTSWLTNTYFPTITPLFVFILKARTAVLSYLSAEKAKQTLPLPKLSDVYGDPMWLWKCCSQKYVVFLSSPSRILNSRCCDSFIRLALTGRMSDKNILSVILLSADWNFLFRAEVFFFPFSFSLPTLPPFAAPPGSRGSSPPRSEGHITRGYHLPHEERQGKKNICTHSPRAHC